MDPLASLWWRLTMNETLALCNGLPLDLVLDRTRAKIVARTCRWWCGEQARLLDGDRAAVVGELAAL